MRRKNRAVQVRVEEIVLVWLTASAQSFIASAALSVVSREKIVPLKKPLTWFLWFPHQSFFHAPTEDPSEYPTEYPSEYPTEYPTEDPSEYPLRN
jgi:hypothetical protein